jgi:hypothetical protein
MVINKCVEDEWGGKRGSDEAMGRGLGIHSISENA